MLPNTAISTKENENQAQLCEKKTFLKWSTPFDVNFVNNKL